MPIYEYRCERGHTFDVMQRIGDDPVTVCSTCDASVQRVFHPVAVHFKGSGFYTTDYGRKGRGSGSDGGDSKEGSSAGGDSKAGGEKKAAGEKKDKAAAKSSSSTD